MVELHLCTHLPHKALSILNFIEKTLFNKSSSPDKDELSRDSSTDSDAWRVSVSQYKIRCFLMLKSLKMCKREMKALVGSQGPAVPTVFLKSQFEYSRGNYEKTIRMLSSTANHVLNSSLSSVIRGPLRNAAAMYFNNLGVTHFHLRKHNLGVFYLRRAAEENMKTIIDAHKQDDQQKSGLLSTAVLADIGISRHYEILYNLGIELLHCGQPLSAFDCLLETLQQYQVNPCLWLRLAECCIMVHRPSNDAARSHTKKMEVVSGAVGSGLHRKLILGSGVRVDKSSSTSESMAIPMATMEFAALCLDNALLLLPDQPSATASTTASEGSSEQRASTDTVLVAAPPGNPLKSDEVCSLRCSVLACRAYVALYHSDHLVALKYAESLLRQPRLSGAHRYLAHMYMAECLVALDCIADGIDHLSPDLVTDIGTVFPTEHKSDQDKSEKNGDTDVSEPMESKGARYPWSPNSVHQAKAIMMFNLAATHAMRGEHEKALQHLGKVTQLIGQPLPAQMYYLKIYLELMEGRRKVVHSLLRDHFGHVTSAR